VSRALVLSAKPEEASLLSLMEFRGPLEVQAAQLAAERRTDLEAVEIVASAGRTVAMNDETAFDHFGAEDDHFHALIYTAARNPYLLTVLGAIREIQHTAVQLIVSASGSIPIASEQHRKTAEAVAAGDVEAAGAAMKEHIDYSARALRQTLALPEEERLTRK
jgi:DNA-binding FadR family transcriptional regulator